MEKEENQNSPSAEQIQDTTNETEKTEENLDTGEKVRVDALNQAENAWSIELLRK